MEQPTNAGSQAGGERRRRSSGSRALPNGSAAWWLCTTWTSSCGLGRCTPW